MHEQSRTQLLPSEDLFRALVQNSSDMIRLLDADGTVVYQSPSIERLLGYRPEDRIGHNAFIDAIVHPDDRGYGPVPALPRRWVMEGF
jgi:PAS domain S-box-containing protein